MNARNQTPEPEEEFVDIAGFKQFEEAGETITGYYLGYHQEQGVNPLTGKAYLCQHAVMTDGGIFRFNETVQLVPLRTAEIGSRVRVVYEGEGEKSQMGNRIRKFRVMMPRNDYTNMQQKVLAMAKSGEYLKLTTATPTDPDNDPFAEG